MRRPAPQPDLFPAPPTEARPEAPRDVEPDAELRSSPLGPDTDLMTSPSETEGGSGRVTAVGSAPAPSGAGPHSKAARIVALAQQAILTLEERGHLDTLLDRQINTASTKQMRTFLYDEPPTGCGFQKRYIKENNRNTDRLACDIDALLANYRLKPDRRLELCLLLSDRRTQIETLDAPLDKDGRLRFALSIAGTKVGRMSCYKSNTGSGYGLHSVQDKHRRLFLADPGHDFYEADLTGADTWTVAAECRALGDSTMWDDLLAGLKPAKVLSLLYLEGLSVNSQPREALVAPCKALPKDWLYDSAKKATHGSNYGEGDVKMAETILRDSWESGQGLATVTAAQCKRLQSLYFARYPGVKRWQDRVRMLLKRDGFLVAASGLKRDFFGRKDDHATQKEAFAFCPAANTAHACNLALLKLWADRAEGVQPLFTRHDSVLFQAPVEKRAWIAGRIASWFDNPLQVAGTTFTIPYECLRGPNWGELKPI